MKCYSKLCELICTPSFTLIASLLLMFSIPAQALEWPQEIDADGGKTLFISPNRSSWLAMY